MSTQSLPKTVSIAWPMSGLALAMLLSSLGTSIANVALPTLAQAFHASFPQVQWVVLAYLLAMTVLVVAAGRAGDVFGHRRTLLAGISLFAVASAVCGVAPTLEILLAARAIQGLGAAVLMALAMALVREAVPAARTGTAMGLLGTTSAIGTALGPSLGGVLLAGSGWRAVFLVLVPLGALDFVLVHRHLPSGERRARLETSAFDWRGTLLLGVALAAYALAMTVGGAKLGWPTAALLAIAGGGAWLFARAQAKAASPLIRLAVLREPGLVRALIMNALVATVIITTLVVGPFFLSISLGLDKVAVGLVLSIGPVMSALTGIVAGRFVDRWGPARLVTVGLAVMLAGCAGLGLLPHLWGLPGYVAALVILTPGYQLFLSANNTAVMVDVQPDQRGVVSGVLNLSRNLGLITGASAMGALFAFAAGTASITSAAPRVVDVGMRTTFGVAAALVAVAAAISLGRRAFSATKQPR